MSTETQGHHLVLSPAMRARLPSLLLLLPLLVACGNQAAEDVEEEEQEPLVGVFELPLSLRYVEQPPASAVQIEMSPAVIRVNGEDVVTLENGRVPEAELVHHVIRHVRSAVQSERAPRAAITAAAMVPWRTTSQVLHTLAESNIHEAHFAVRAVGQNPPEVRWMPVRGFSTVAHDAEEVELEGHARPWSDFVDVWRDVYEACRSARFIACDAKRDNTAVGGTLAMAIFTQGEAMRVQYRRIEPPEDPPADDEPRNLYRGPAAVDRSLVPQIGEEILEEDREVPPEVEGVFTVDYQTAVQDPSLISRMTQPVCGATTCTPMVEIPSRQVVTMRVVTLLGATFPNGSTEPRLAFRLQPEE